MAAAADEGKVLGVLFVHGIGEQRRGQTLVACAEPIIDWLLRADPTERLPGSAGVLVHQVEVAESAEREPAHLRLRVCEGVAPPIANPVELLLAEAWWAESFGRAKFAPLVRWSITTAPRLIETYAFRRADPLIEQAKRSWTTFLESKDDPPGDLVRGAFLAYFGLHIVLVVVLVLSVVVLGAFSAVVAAGLLALFIPLAFVALLFAGLIPRLRRSALRLQLRLANSLGDSYVLLTSPVRFGAMTEAVRRSLDWLFDNGCSEVAVVAHSQGAVVAHRALIQSPGRRISEFITYGSGLSKIARARQMLAHESRLLLAGLLRIVIGLVFLGLIASRFTPSAQIDAWTTFWIFFGACVLWAVAVGLGSIEVEGVTSEDLALTSFDARPDFRWTDYFTSADPVPDGRLPVDRPWFESRELQTYSSATADHSAYWRNDEQFVAPIVRALAGLAGATDETDPKVIAFDERLASAGRMRKARVEALSAVRIVNLVAIPMLLIGLGTATAHRIGADIYALARVAQHGRARGAATLGTVLVLAAGGVWLRVCLLSLWRALMRSSSRNLPSSDALDSAGAASLMFAAAAAILPLAAAVAVAWRFTTAGVICFVSLPLAVAAIGVGLWAIGTPADEAPEDPEPTRSS